MYMRQCVVNCTICNHNLTAVLHFKMKCELPPSVEGFYCKRPIRCLASSEILTPPPPWASGYPPPPPAFGAGRGHTRWVESGWGVIRSEDARHCSVPEFMDPVVAKTSPKRSFSMTENGRFGLVFVKTGSITSGTIIYICKYFVPPSYYSLIS